MKKIAIRIVTYLMTLCVTVTSAWNDTILPKLSALDMLVDEIFQVSVVNMTH